MSDERPPQALSFSLAADAYDRARPSYPDEAVRWLTGAKPLVILELGAGTGKLTRALVEQGHTVIATDPLPGMLVHLRRNVPRATVATATAERIPLSSRSVDVVVCAQSFHWFDHQVALPEIARVLRPGGSLSLVWNRRDESIPWVRKLNALIGGDEQHNDVTRPLLESDRFGWVEERTYRNWSRHNHETLADLVRSHSAFAMLYEERQQSLLAAVDALYADYGRGHDGMLLPYVTRCYRAVVQSQPEPEPPRAAGGAPGRRTPPDDPDTLLIDFT